MKSVETKASDTQTPWMDGFKNHEVLKFFQVTVRTLKIMSKKALR